MLISFVLTPGLLLRESDGAEPLFKSSLSLIIANAAWPLLLPETVSSRRSDIQSRSSFSVHRGFVQFAGFKIAYVSTTI